MPPATPPARARFDRSSPPTSQSITKALGFPLSREHPMMVSEGSIEGKHLRFPAPFHHILLERQESLCVSRMHRLFAPRPRPSWVTCWPKSSTSRRLWRRCRRLRWPRRGRRRRPRRGRRWPRRGRRGSRFPRSGTPPRNRSRTTRQTRLLSRLTRGLTWQPRLLDWWPKGR